MEWWAAAGTAFVAIAPVELPDKTFVATLVLATRYPPWPVWLGVISAFRRTRHRGGSRRRRDRTAAAASGTPGGGRAVHRRGGDHVTRSAAGGAHRTGPGAGVRPAADARSAGARAYVAAFLLLATAEWGDLSQLLTAGLVASGRPPTAVLVRAWLALAMISGAAILLGRIILRRVGLAVLRYVAAAVCGALAVATAVSALT